MTTEQLPSAIVSADVAGYLRLMGRDESGTAARRRVKRAWRLCGGSASPCWICLVEDPTSIGRRRSIPSSSMNMFRVNENIVPAA
jgi:hypothetical protein